MILRIFLTARLLCFFCLLSMLGACSSDERTIEVRVIEVHTAEDQAIAGRLSAGTGAGTTFRVSSARNGFVTLDASSGTYEFVPAPDFFGQAGFDAVEMAGNSTTRRYQVRIDVSNVNDAPRIDEIEDMSNSAIAEFVEVAISVSDPDPVQPTVSVVVDDPTVVDAIFSESTGQLALKALRPGTATVEVVAFDGEAESSVSFQFMAQEVWREFSLGFPDTSRGAVRVENSADAPLEFVLEHNDYPVFESPDHVVTYVRSLPDAVPSEGFGRKLWRFLRNSVYHDVPLGEKKWLYDPAVTVNSLGWGFCGNVSGAYVAIARAAGYNARVWGLSGHVVPEIEVDGEWRMYDPDLAVYYKNDEGKVASVADLVSNSTLISSPIDPIFDVEDYDFPYSAVVAEIYGSEADNYDAEDVFLAEHAPVFARIVLPPAATLVYPGRWTDPPTGFDGSEPYEVQHFRQALLRVNDGWTGSVTLPWVLWDVLGEGQIGIDDVSYDIGSEALLDRLRNTDLPITSTTIFSGTDVGFVFMINAVRFNILETTQVRVRSLQTWALDLRADALPDSEGAGPRLASSLQKPRPTNVP